MGTLAGSPPRPRGLAASALGRVRAGLAGAREPLLIALASRLLVLAAFAAIALARGRGPFGHELVRLLGSWDGTWYVRISELGYDPAIAHGDSPAFFPLWPLVLHGATWLLPGVAPALVGSAVAQALFAAALVVVHRLVGERLGPLAARDAAVAIAFFPTAHVFSAVYSESLFLLLTASAFLLAERRRMAAAGVVGMLATLTRPTGILLVPALALVVLARDGWRPSWRLARALAPLALLPAALLAFQWYVTVRTGVPDAVRLAQERGWGRGFTPLLVVQMPVAGAHALVDLARGLASWPTVVYALAASLWAWLVIWAVVRRPVPLAWTAFAAGVVIMPAVAGSYMSFARFGMAAFPFAALLAVLAAHVPWVARLSAALLPLALLGAMWWTYALGSFTP